MLNAKNKLKFGITLYVGWYDASDESIVCILLCIFTCTQLFTSDKVSARGVRHSSALFPARARPAPPHELCHTPVNYSNGSDEMCTDNTNDTLHTKLLTIIIIGEPQRYLINYPFKNFWLLFTAHARDAYVSNTN